MEPNQPEIALRYDRGADDRHECLVLNAATATSNRYIVEDRLGKRALYEVRPIE
jgi:hypothetical protein